MQLRNTTSEEQKARRNKGFGVGSRNIDHNGYENDYLVVLSHSHYDGEYRRHIWNATCKGCERNFKIASERVKHAKSCGCRQGKAFPNSFRKQELEQSTLPNLLTMKWDKSLKAKLK